jgi:ankyrin repeat protein
MEQVHRLGKALAILIQLVKGNVVNEITAAVEQGQEDTIQRLIGENPVLLSQRLSGGQSILHKAVFQDKPSIVELLLQLGANVNIRTTSGNSPLHIAAMEGRYEPSKVLVAWGAEIESRNARMLTPLFYAASGGSDGSKAIARMLLSKGAALDFNSAVALGEVDMVGKWLSSNPNAWKVAPVPNDLLFNAVRIQSKELTKLLLEHGVEPNEKPAHADPPLFLAVSRSNNDVEIVRLLLQYGADANATDSFGESVLTFAKGIAPEETISLLREHGAMDEKA